MDRRKGPYYVNGGNSAEAIGNEDVLDYNTAPQSQPGLWCKWISTPDGSKLVWNGYKKFYAPKEWLEYLITHFFGTEPVAKLVHSEYFHFLQGHTLNGIISIEEDNDNYWFIVVKNNQAFIKDSLIKDLEQENITTYRDKELLIIDILEFIKLKKKFHTSYNNDFIILHTEEGCIKYRN